MRRSGKKSHYSFSSQVCELSEYGLQLAILLILKKTKKVSTASCTSKMKKIDVFSFQIIATHLLATAPFNFSKKARNQKIAFYRLILGFKGSRIS